MTLSEKELIEEPNLFENRTHAIVFCPSQGALDIFAKLKKTVFVTHVFKDLLSKSEAKEPAVVDDYSYCIHILLWDQISNNCKVFLAQTLIKRVRRH